MDRTSLMRRLPNASRRNRRTRSRNVLVEVAEGAIAGVVATWAMGKLTRYLYKHESRPVQRREDEARGGRTVYEAAAMRAARALHRTLSPIDRKRYGNAIHWMLGIGTGMLYGALGQWARTRTARGVAYGTAVFLVMDEVLTPAMRLTPGPRAFPWQTHARGLAGHLLYGTVTDSVFRVLRRIGSR